MGLSRTAGVSARLGGAPTREGKLEGGHRSGCSQKPFAFPFLLLHPAVLEPDFDLGVIQLQAVGYLNSSGSSQVLIEMKLFLQFRQLLGAEIRANGAGGTSGSILCDFAFLRGVPLYFHPLERAEGYWEAGRGRNGLRIGAGRRGRSLEGPGVALSWLFETSREGARLAKGRAIHLAAKEEGAASREDSRGGVMDVRPTVVGRAPESAREVVRGPGAQEAVVRSRGSF